MIPARRASVTPVLIVAALGVVLSTIAPAPFQLAGAPSGAPVIRRDTFGVPHILAPTEALAAEAHGYATAEDHVDILARAFLRARGELAAVIGPQGIASDLLIKQLRIHEYAETRFGSLPTTMRGILDGYAAGYNRYLAEHRAEAPEWAQPITGIDVLAHCRAVVLVDFSLNLGPWRSRAAEPAATAAARGSTAWAIGRGRSASGRGLLLANPHLPWSGAFTFHEVHLTVPGQINVYGGTLVGFPVVAIGFNEFLGWTHTVNNIDADDLYALTLDPANPTRYIYDGRPRDFDIATVTVKVKGAHGMETRTVEQLWSHLGPVVRTANGALAFKSANLDQVSFLTQWNAMGKARSIEAFRDSLQLQALPMFNIVYADRAGNTYYLYNGRIPRRPPGPDWSGVVSGATSALDWTSIHPVAELPQLLNPPGGYVQNCNDAPWYTTPHRRLDPAAFPGYMAVASMGLRGQESVRLLEADARITLDEVKRYKGDTTLLLADRLKPELLTLAEHAQEPVFDPALAVLRGWDNRAAPESRGAVLFIRWWERYQKSAKPVARVPWSADDPYETPKGIGDPARAVTAFRESIDEVVKEFGRVDPPWGDAFRFRRGSIDLPMGGAASQYGLLRVIGYQQTRDGRFAATFGDSFVLAVEFSQPVQAYTVLAYSQSSAPSHRHYADQSALFARGLYKPVHFSERAIENHLERSYELPRRDVPRATPSR